MNRGRTASDEAVSVIVRCDGASGSLVRETLAAIGDQGRPAQVVLVGGGDLDGLRTALGPTTSIELASTPSMAEAVELVRCELVGVQTAGDLYLPEAIALGAEALHRHPEAPLVRASVCAVDADGALVAEIPPAAKRPWSGALFRRGALQGHDLQVDHSLALLVAQPAAVEVELPLAAVRVGGGGTPPTRRWSLGRLVRRVRSGLRGHRDQDPPTISGWDVAGTGSHDATRPLPDGAAATLTDDNPRLVELRRRYASFDSPLRVTSFWADEYRERDLELHWFRGDNAFVWQYRNLRDQTVLRYSLYLRQIAARDHHRLLERLVEDGAFGCFVFDVPGYPPVSRDMLDSINEMYFLDRVWGLFDRDGFSVLDIGAGYGRLAHRMATAVPGLRRYHCTDGVPESTFLCEYYLAFRGTDRGEVVPVDELDQLPAGEIDLAINVHSFSEMSRATIDAWLQLLDELQVPRLLVVPNDPDDFLSYETDHRRLEFASLFDDHGFELTACEPVISSDHLRRMIGMWDKLYFFERREVTA